MESAHEPCTSAKSTMQASKRKLTRSLEYTSLVGLCCHRSGLALSPWRTSSTNCAPFPLEHATRHVRRHLALVILFSIMRLHGCAPLAGDVGPPRHLASCITTELLLRRIVLRLEPISSLQAVRLFAVGDTSTCPRNLLHDVSGEKQQQTTV